MEKSAFKIVYNGKDASVSRIDDNVFVVQISYKPLYLQLTDQDGSLHWVDLETKIETPLSQEIGKLISEHPDF